MRVAQRVGAYNCPRERVWVLGGRTDQTLDKGHRLESAVARVALTVSQPEQNEAVGFYFLGAGRRLVRAGSQVQASAPNAARQHWSLDGQAIPQLALLPPLLHVPAGGRLPLQSPISSHPLRLMEGGP